MDDHQQFNASTNKKQIDMGKGGRDMPNQKMRNDLRELMAPEDRGLAYQNKKPPPKNRFALQQRQQQQMKKRQNPAAAQRNEGIVVRQNDPPAPAHRLNKKERQELADRIVARKIAFAATRIPADSKLVPEISFRTTSSAYCWSGWEGGQYFPRFIGKLKTFDSGETKANMKRTVLHFSLHSAEVVMVYGWKNDAAILDQVNQLGKTYTIYNTKVMTNYGLEFDGITSKDRGGDLPFRLLFEATSRICYGFDGESPSTEFFAPVSKPTIKEMMPKKKQIVYQEVSSDGENGKNNGEEEEEEDEEDNRTVAANIVEDRAGGEEDDFDEQDADDEEEDEGEYYEGEWGEEQEDEQEEEEEDEDQLCTRLEGPNSSAGSAKVRAKLAAAQNRHRNELDDNPPALLREKPSAPNKSNSVAEKANMKRKAPVNVTKGNESMPDAKKRKKAVQPEQSTAADSTMPIQEEESGSPKSTLSFSSSASSSAVVEQIGFGRRGRAVSLSVRRLRHHNSPPFVEEENDEDENGRILDRWPQDEEEEAEEMDEAELDKYFSVETWETTKSKSRGTTTEQCTVHFKDFEDSSRPQNLLARCIDRLLQRVLAGRPEPPARIGFQLQCPNFERPFYVPLRPPHQNTPQVIADALQQVCEQSGDGTDLFTDPCQTKVLAVWPNSGGGRGEGGGCSEMEHWLHRPPLCRSLVRVVNPGDTFCMARAILLGLMDRQCRLNRWSRHRFQQMCEQQHLHGELAEQMMHRAGCRINKPHYGLPDLGRVQRMLDTEMGVGQVRLVVFDQQAAFQVIWKGQQRARFNLCLVYNSRHYNYVSRPEQLIQARAYCVDCESRVTNRTHPDGCRAVCRLCYRFGMEQPCKPDGTGRRRCAHCGFHFANATCFAAHQQVLDPTPPGFEGWKGRKEWTQSENICLHFYIVYFLHKNFL